VKTDPSDPWAPRPQGQTDSDSWGSDQEFLDSCKEMAHLKTKLDSTESLCDRARHDPTAPLSPGLKALAEGKLPTRVQPTYDPAYRGIPTSRLISEIQNIGTHLDRPDIVESVSMILTVDETRLNKEVKARTGTFFPSSITLTPDFDNGKPWMYSQINGSTYKPHPYQTSPDPYLAKGVQPFQPFQPSPLILSAPTPRPPSRFHEDLTPRLSPRFPEDLGYEVRSPQQTPQRQLFEPGTLPYSALIDHTPTRPQEPRIPNLPVKAPTFNKDTSSYRDMEEFLRAAERCFDGVLLKEEHYLRKLITLVDDVTAAWIDDHLLGTHREPRFPWAQSKMLLLAEFKHPLHVQLALTEFGAFRWNSKFSIKENCRRFLHLRQRAAIPDTDARAVEQLHFSLPKDLYLYIKLWRDAQPPNRPISTTSLARQAGQCAITDVINPTAQLGLTSTATSSRNATCTFCGGLGHTDKQCRKREKIAQALRKGLPVSWPTSNPTNGLTAPANPTHTPPTTAPTVPPNAPSYTPSPQPANPQRTPWRPPTNTNRAVPTAAAVELLPTEDELLAQEFGMVTCAESSEEYEEIIAEACATEPIPKNDNRPRCPLTINTHRTYALCDTGTTVSLISRQFVEEHNIPFSASSQPLKLAIQGVTGATLGTASITCRTTAGELTTSAYVADLPGHSDFYMSDDLCKRFGITLTGIPLEFPPFPTGPCSK
jgi:hypothetical protein